MLRAEISKAGDITDLELIDGPIELAESAVAAVRQWKYKPYLLGGQPVTVDTQIQVNYQLLRKASSAKYGRTACPCRFAEAGYWQE